jgi:hypothetical protein
MKNAECRTQKRVKIGLTQSRRDRREEQNLFRFKTLFRIDLLCAPCVSSESRPGVMNGREKALFGI